MSSKTLAVTIRADRVCGAVIESSIGAVHVGTPFEVRAGAPLPASGPFDRVVAALAPQAAAFRVLDMPFRDRRRVALAVGPAVEEHLPYSLDDAALAWDFAAPPGPAGASVLAALADPARLDAARAALAELGVEPAPQKIVWMPTATLAAYRRALGDDATFTAVDLDDAGTLIARVEGGRIAALRVLAPCDDELLLRNTAWCLTSLGADGRVVVGGSSAERLARALAARLPGSVFESLPERSPVEGFADALWRERTALVGLVLAATGDAPSPILDFADGGTSMFGAAALAELQAEARPLLRWAAAALLLAVTAVGLDYAQLFVERRALSHRAEEIYTSAVPAGSGGVGRKLKLEMRLRELTGKAGAAAAGAGGSPLGLLAALSRDVPKDLDIVLDQVDQLAPSAKVSGHADSFEAVTRMQEALTRTGHFARVEVKDVHAAVTGGGVEFLVELAAPATGGGA